MFGKIALRTSEKSARVVIVMCVLIRQA